MFDFYYSRKTEKRCIEVYGEDHLEISFKGIPCTEIVDHGKRPLTLYMGDLILLGTGTLEDFEIN
jgi:hypothetical protein